MARPPPPKAPRAKINLPGSATSDQPGPLFPITASKINGLVTSPGAGSGVEPDYKALLQALRKLNIDQSIPTENAFTEQSRTMYAYASVHPSLYSGRNAKAVQVIVPVGPIQICLGGSMEDAAVDIFVHIAVPLLPAISIGGFNGRINDEGLPLPIDVPKTIKGSLTLYGESEEAVSKDKPATLTWLCLEGDVHVYNERYAFTLRLLPYPQKIQEEHSRTFTYKIDVEKYKQVRRVELEDDRTQANSSTAKGK